MVPPPIYCDNNFRPDDGDVEYTRVTGGDYTGLTASITEADN